MAAKVKRFFNMTGFNPGNRGIALILVTALMFLFFIFISLALDISYVYSVRGQLQNSADAGALAGAMLLEEGNGPTEQDAARDEAKEFAEENFAAGAVVQVERDPDNDTLGPDNDITVGFWDVDTSTYLPADDPTFDGKPVNAVQVRTRMNGDSPGGPVRLVFGRVLDWPEMSVASMAIAHRAPGPTTSLSLCTESCLRVNDTLATEGEAKLHFKRQRLPKDPDTKKPLEEFGIAWTEFSSTSRATEFGPDSTIAQLIRGETIYRPVCNETIYTQEAASAQIMRILEAEFIKQNALSGGNGWEVIVPVLDTCVFGPDYQPTEPYPVTYYAIVNITGVDRRATDPSITINSMQCIACPALNLLGKNANLVK
jgi:Flp pilus assembly protein TadG